MNYKQILPLQTPFQFSGKEYKSKTSKVINIFSLIFCDGIKDLKYTWKFKPITSLRFLFSFADEKKEEGLRETDGHISIISEITLKVQPTLSFVCFLDLFGGDSS